MVLLVDSIETNQVTGEVKSGNLLIALLGFVSTIALAKFLMRGEVIE